MKKKKEEEEEEEEEEKWQSGKQNNQKIPIKHEEDLEHSEKKKYINGFASGNNDTNYHTYMDTFKHYKKVEPVL